MNSPQREAVLKKFLKQLGFQSKNIKLTTDAHKAKSRRY